jgi:tetratricopeptide (TPR) repeat protein
LREGRFEEAAGIAAASLNANPRDTEALTVLGLSYLRQNQPDKALRIVQDRLGRVPDWAAGQAVLGSLALQARKTPLAEQAFKQALQLDPKSTNAALGLGETYLLSQQPDLAHRYFEMAASLDPKSAVYQVRLGQLAETRGDWKDAIAKYKDALALEPSDALAKNNLAWVYAEHGGELQAALNLAQDAYQTLHNEPSVSDTLGWIYLKEGLPAAALRYLTECVSEQPANAAFHYHLAVAYFQTGRKVEAKHELETAFGLRNDFSGAQDARALLAKIASR